MTDIFSLNYWVHKWKTGKLFVFRRLAIGRPGNCRSAEFEPLFTQLHLAETNLRQASGGLETQFLAISSELEALSHSGDLFLNQIEKLVGLATGQDDSTVFSNGVGLIEKATLFLVGCEEETDEMLGLLRNFNVEIEDLLEVETELQRSMSPLKFMQTLFKVESAQLDPQVQQMFAALTQEMEELHDQVRKIFGTRFKELEQTRRTIGLVIAQLEQQSRVLKQVITTHKVQIESSLATLKSELAANKERDVRLNQLSKDFGREVGEVVMGLQFQDIVSQKLQHVTGALPQIEKKFAEFSTAENVVVATEPSHFLQQSCRLEAGQLHAAAEELAKAETTIEGGIQRVLSHVKEMDSHCLSLQEFKLLTTSFDGMVQVLVDMLEEVRNLVAATVASAAEAYELLRPLGGLASDLTAVVREISSRMRLVGLNAQIQAVWASAESRGAGLEVLSARTNEISEQTNDISEQAAEQLDALVAGLAQTVGAFGELKTSGLAQQAILNEQGRSEEGKLHAFRDRALNTLSAIADSIENIQS